MTRTAHAASGGGLQRWSDAFSEAEQKRLLRDDSEAWKRVCIELVVIVSAGAATMAGTLLWVFFVAN
jgi:hypothetical protein